MIVYGMTLKLQLVEVIDTLKSAKTADPLSYSAFPLSKMLCVLCKQSSF